MTLFIISGTTVYINYRTTIYINYGTTIYINYRTTVYINYGMTVHMMAETYRHPRNKSIAPTIITSPQRRLGSHAKIPAFAGMTVFIISGMTVYINYGMAVFIISGMTTLLDAELAFVGFSYECGDSISRLPLLLIGLTTPAISICSIRRAARL